MSPGCRGVKRAAVIARPPQKWRKYELLELFGLADTEFLRQSIRRYQWSERIQVFEAVRREFEAQAHREGVGNSLFVVKFVPPRLAMLLPNIRIQTVEDFASLENALSTPDDFAFQEVWFCRTAIAVGTFSVAGRIRVDSSGATVGQTIEQVWRCSPRLIEVLDEHFPYPFVRAFRPSWGWAPRIEHIHRPKAAPESRKVITEQFRRALRDLERIRERLEAFVDNLWQAGANVCALEYKIESNRLQIIDWDAPNEADVLDILLPHACP